MKPAAWNRGLRLWQQRPQRNLLLRPDDGAELFALKPDIVLERPGEGFEAILDTKWKVLDDSQKKLGISQADLYQMASYALRYGCNRLGLIYPATSGFSESTLFRVQNTPIEIAVYPVDLPASVMDANWNGWADMCEPDPSPGLKP